MGRFTRYLIHIVQPTRCIGCGKVIYSHQYFCSHCRTQLPHIALGECPWCGKNHQTDCNCANDFELLFPCNAPFHYEGCIRQGILTIKKGTETRGAAVFGKIMANRVTRLYGTDFDGIVYVPITKKRWKQRGYNQSRLLAKAIADRLDLPLLDNALVRLYDAPDQHRSSRHSRKGNVFGVFEANAAAVAGKRLLLVDDVFTTGTTINECGKMLLLADCDSVCGITLAMAKPAKNTTNNQQEQRMV